jgi:tetratricopeptide (TPR) repeat protein
MRPHYCLACCSLLLLAACAETPVQEPPAPAVAATRKVPDGPAVGPTAEHRQRAQRYAQAGDLASAAREWQIVTLLAPQDEAARAQLETTHAAIRQGVRDNLQLGNTALRNGDSDHATLAMLKVLSLDPDNPDAPKVLREIDRQKLQRIQGTRASRVEAQTNGAGTSRAAPASAPTKGGGVESYDIDQRIEMFKAGDLAGGLRELRAFVDANPTNDGARQRIATTVYERAAELEAKGAREQALPLYEQAASLRGKPVADWTAHIQGLRKALSEDYYDRGMQAFRTDATVAIKLWETSLRYDPQNRKTEARLREAKIAQDKLKQIEKEGKP